MAISDPIIIESWQKQTITTDTGINAHFQSDLYQYMSTQEYYMYENSTYGVQQSYAKYFLSNFINTVFRIIKYHFKPLLILKKKQMLWNLTDKMKSPMSFIYNKELINFKEKINK